MNKQLQDLAWSVLPKEFKEEVKKLYNHNPGAKPMPENTSRGKSILRDIFGHDNLTIDELVTKGYVPDPAKSFDSILKDGFRNERRLNIAAMMAQAILTRIDDTPQVIADTAFRYADALIAESEKGGVE